MAFAPTVTSLASFPTPISREAILMRKVDSTLPSFKQWVYGEPHPDAVHHPAHVLVHVEQAPQVGTDGWQHWWYAAPRADQDLYNWEYVDANIGGTIFRAVKRTYIITRDEFNSTSPLMGSVMGNVPEDKFTDEFILSDRDQTRVEAPLDSIFVREVRTYVKRETISKINTDSDHGNAILETTTLYYRGEVVAGVTIESRFNNPTSAFWGYQTDGTFVNGAQLTDNWFSVITTGSMDSVLASFSRSMPTTVDLDLPDVLTALAVVWNTHQGSGVFDSNWTGVSKWAGPIQSSLSGSESATAEGSASIQGSLVPTIFSPSGKDLPATSFFFYMPLVAGAISEAALLARLTTLAGSSVVRWPVFKPVSHTVIVKGSSVSCSAKASASSEMSAGADHISKNKNEGTGKSYDVSLSSETVKLPPTINALINISNTSPTVPVATSSCDVGWQVLFTDVLLGENVAIYPTTAAETATLSCVAGVSTISIPATTITGIPSSGRYLTSLKISPYNPKWMICFAEVINANVIP